MFCEDASLLMVVLHELSDKLADFCLWLLAASNICYFSNWFISFCLICFAALLYCCLDKWLAYLPSSRLLWGSSVC